MLLVGLSSFVSAQAVARDVKLSGMGIRKCAEWNQWKEGRNGETRALTLEWANGFIAGHNVYAKVDTGAASAVVVNAKVLLPLLDSYCLKNPESRIISGLIEITQSLGGAKINLEPKVSPQQSPPPDKKPGRDT